MLQTRGETGRALLTVQQSSEASERKFPLSDLLNVPIQRVLKYPLLMKVSGCCLPAGPAPLASHFASAAGAAQVC